MNFRALAMLICCVAVTSWAQDADGGTPTEAPAPMIDAGVAEPTPSAPDAGAPAVAAKLPVDLSAKYGEGVTFRAGEWSLNLRGRFQAQALALVPSEGSTAVRSNQFAIRRARIVMKGDMPYHLMWQLHLGFSSFDLETDAPNPIRDLFVQWTWLRDLSVRVGQQKVQFDVQRVVSSAYLQMVDRSLATLEFNLDRDVGVQVYSDDLFGLGRFKYSLGVYQGDGRNRVGTNVGLLYTARVRASLVGNLDEKIEGDLGRSSDFRLAIGGGVARNIGTTRPRSTFGTPYRLAGGFDYTHATADLHVKWHGVSLLSEFYWRQADKDSRTGTISGADVTEYSRSGWGFYAQAGGFVTDWLELTVRYGELRPLGNTDPTLTRQREIGGGFNVFFLKHDLKLQADYFWLDDGAGGNGRNQVRLIAQVFF
ncbi:MAG: porin [Myxococcaceae bacterium]